MERGGFEGRRSREPHRPFVMYNGVYRARKNRRGDRVIASVRVSMPEEGR